MRLPTQLLRRSRNAHKGDFGHILIIAGSARYSGAAVLSAGAAYRSGAGLVTLAIPRGINNAVIKVKPLEVMTLPLPETSVGTISPAAYSRICQAALSCDVVVIGPGLSTQVATKELVKRLIANLVKPLIIDADGLNALVGCVSQLKAIKSGGSRPIITPHPAELARLIGLSARQVQKNRKIIAQKFAIKYNINLVLKGRGTIVTDGTRTYINTTGNPGMATAGSGDVLTGMIAAFLGQGLNPFAAAKYAVYLHGLSGDLAAKVKTQMGMIASDIVQRIPDAIKKCTLRCRRSSVGRASVL